MGSLEAELREVKRERDELKARVAKLEGGMAVLQDLLDKKK